METLLEVIGALLDLLGAILAGSENRKEKKKKEGNNG
ncbi:hypothetical protein [Bacillus phage BC-T25]|nr:hypothetical protein [Bacillus phage BC-T25]